jgi:hypothetical protein
MMPSAPSGTGLQDIGELVFAREPPRGASTIECLRAVWEEARWEARCAYDIWHGEGGLEAYVVYLATQDRADAAQDTLARIALGQPSSLEQSSQRSL